MGAAGADFVALGKAFDSDCDVGHVEVVSCQLSVDGCQLMVVS